MADLTPVLQDDLSAFLGAAARKPFIYGAFDCCLWLADWVRQARGGADPAKGLRGRYRTEAGCKAILAREGGVEAVVARCADRAGLLETSEPLSGDIGVAAVWTKGGADVAGAICAGSRWAVLARNGLIFAPLIVHRAWRV